MPNQRQTSLKFPLKESVIFASGQEIGDLISISLSPEVRIFHEDPFVVIKGALHLSGEYYPQEESDLFASPPDVTDVLIQHVDVRTDGISEFSHRFPVDITIPLKRIQDIEEVEIEIHSFDYDITEPQRLEIIAEIMIHGLYEEREAEESVVESTPEEEIVQTDLHVEDSQQDQEEYTEVEVPIEREEGQLEDTLEEIPIMTEPTLGTNLFNFEPGHTFEKEETNWETQTEFTNLVNDEVKEDEVKAESREELETSIKELENFKQESVQEEQQSSLEVMEKEEEEEELLVRHIEEEEKELEPFYLEMRSLPEKTENQDQEEKTTALKAPVFPKLTYEANKRTESSYLMNAESSSLLESLTSSYDVAESSPAIEQEKPKKKSKKKDKYETISFADFFTRKEDVEETKSRLRMRLVQSGDTLQSIADEYDVTVQQILRANQLDASFEVSEGQVLYIPTKTVPLVKKENF